MIYTRIAQYHETDQMKIIHHSNYIKWMEESRVFYLKYLGISYKDTEKNGVFSPVINVDINYINPIHFDDTIDIEVKIIEYTGVKVCFSYSFCNKETGVLCAKASSKHCFIDKDGKVLSMKRTDSNSHCILESALNKNIK